MNFELVTHCPDCHTSVVTKVDRYMTIVCWNCGYEIAWIDPCVESAKKELSEVKLLTQAIKHADEVK